MNATPLSLTLRIERNGKRPAQVCEPIPRGDRDYHQSDLIAAIAAQHGLRCARGRDGDLYLLTKTHKRTLHVDL